MSDKLAVVMPVYNERDIEEVVLRKWMLSKAAVRSFAQTIAFSFKCRSFLK